MVRGVENKQTNKHKTKNPKPKTKKNTLLCACARADKDVGVFEELSSLPFTIRPQYRRTLLAHVAYVTT